MREPDGEGGQHHGSAEETTARFLDAVGATTILASNDRTPSGKQRELDKLIAGDPARTLLRTDRCGAITVTLTRGRLAVRSARGCDCAATPPS